MACRLTRQRKNKKCWYFDKRESFFFWGANLNPNILLLTDDFSNRTDDDKTPAPNDDTSSSQTDLPEDQSIKIYKSIKEFDKNLPHTVTKLTTPHGSVVYLVGTAHFSKESQDDVSLVSWFSVPIFFFSIHRNIFKIDFRFRWLEIFSPTLWWSSYVQVVYTSWNWTRKRCWRKQETLI